MRKYTIALAGSLLLGVGCIDNTIVTPENAPTIDALNDSLRPAGLKALAYGVLAQDRAAASGSGYVLFPEIYARDAYRIDSNEPRFVTETLGGTPDPGSFAAGGGTYTAAFTTIRAATSLIKALPGAVDAISPAQRTATSGFIQTIRANAYYRVVETRDTVGVPIQAADPSVVAPLSCKASVLSYIAGQLDSANASLIAAGPSLKLPFPLPTGFSAYGRDYNKVSNIILLNRGLRGKVELYRGLQHQTPVAGAFGNAITFLTQALGGAAPGAVSPATFQNGAYITYVAGGTENTPNPLVDSKVGVNPKAFAGLDSGDTRASKIIKRSTLAGSGLSTTRTFVGSSTRDPANLTMPRAILRDEEIVLLRAQAYFENNQFVEGTADLNSVRTNFGLAPIAVPPTLAAARTAVLYEKRYSLFFEGPQRLVDLRAYGLLKAGVTTAELPGDPFNTAFPIPKGEADARGNDLTVKCP